MKKLLILLSVLSFFSANAQKNSLEVGVGHTWFTTHLLHGSNISVAYRRDLNKTFDFYINVNQSTGLKSAVLNDAFYENYPFALFHASNLSRKVSVGPSFKLLNNTKHRVSFEPLLTIAHYKSISTGGFIRNLNPGVPLESLFFSTPMNQTNIIAAGGTAHVGYRYKVGKNLQIGLDSMFQLYDGNGEFHNNIACSVSF